MIFKWFFLIGFCLTAFSCTNPPQGYGYPNQYNQQPSQNNNNLNTSPLPDPDDNYYNNRQNTDNDRDEVLNNANRGEACEDQRYSHNCYKLCKEMYRRSDDNEECLELDIDNVEEIYDVYSDLKDGGFRKLENIDPEHFELFLNVSIASFDTIIRKEYKRSEGRDLLIWIAENEDIAEIMYDEDDDFRRLGDLLFLVQRFTPETLDKPLSFDIENRQNLFEYAIATGNTPAMDYFLDYILKTHSSCKKTKIYTAGCLTVVCKIGFSVDERDRGQFIYYSNSFVDFIERIIKDGINRGNSAPKWSKGSGENQIDSINDLDDTWAGKTWNPSNDKKPICGGLI